nr:ABC transporter B family member 26, chloroplastic-like isoform X4 [Ziziphus jujuba var. spinosa]
MAVSLSNLRSLCTPYLPHGKTPTTYSSRGSVFNPRTKTQFPVLRVASKRHPFQFGNHALMGGLFAPRAEEEDQDKTIRLWGIIQKWVEFVGSVMPGGSWWSLCESEEEQVAKPVTLLFALRRLWKLVEDDRWVIFVAFGALIIAALSEISMPSILTESVFSAQNGQTTVFTRKSQLLVILCLTSGICSGLRSGCFAVANTILVRRLRETVYSTIISQDINFFDREGVGDLTSRLGADCQRLSDIIGNNINLILRNVLQVPEESCKGDPRFHCRCQRSCTRSTFFDENCSGLWSRKQRTWKWLDKLASVNMRESVAYGIWNLSFNSLYRSMQVLAVLFGGMSMLSGHISAEQLTKYILYCEWLIYATWRVTDNVSSLLQSVGASEKFLQLMDLLPSDQFSSKGVKLQILMGQVQFVNISFHYLTRIKVPVLDRVNLSIHPNEVVAIVGPSGGGKSTLAHLLLRLYEPINGQLQIYVDGFPLRELDIRWLREKIGFVEQEPHLFHMDIKSNIKYGCRGDIKQEDIEWAAKLAYAHDFIMSLPNGYETLVDDNLLSGGQKQRIAIARAILRNPSILILDEATSALDSQSEDYVKGVLHEFKNDIKAKRTVIIIAHRLSTIRNADRIVVMDSGRVIEIGDHAELIRKDGLYSKLVRAQAEGLV